eukprot:NODE_369_length_1730_cov_297.674004_g294_i0.p1 GENE.NODE_369_length_1730_cov_297.674004_g294_i0~~NODE_369_length_1730_cov_297.674004_g294_i0.p1  ORF type:complete len:437 (+),score=113.44 NODE_369_length_1730_cov_297.674004_g294_i0:89-1399(+)
MEGYLFKEAAGLVKGFKKRWISLPPGSSKLTYYSKEGASEAAGSIDLSGGTVAETSEHAQGFVITGPNLSRPYNFGAESAEMKKKWMAVIEAATKLDSSSEAPLPGQSGSVGAKDFEVLKVIGRGSFGKVMKVRKKGTHEIYAMKALRKDVVMREKMVANTKAEKTILQNIHHPFIVKLYYAFQTKDRLYLVLDLLCGGELFFHLKNEGSFTLARSRLYTAEISSALHHLHQQGIIYRDLKPENVVLDKDGHAVLTDFGLAKASVPAKSHTYTFCGTPEYIAPEILLGTGHGKAVDWWAIGILLFEMLAGLPPFYSEDVDAMYAAILNAPLECPKDTVPENAEALLVQLLDRDPEKRLSDGGKVLQQPFFAPIDMVKLLAREIQPEFVPDLSGDDDKYVDKEYTDETTRATVCQPQGGTLGGQMGHDWTFQAPASK